MSRARIHRLSLIVAGFALCASLLAVAPAAARDSYPLNLTVLGDGGEAIAGAAVDVKAELGEPFSVQGTTDKKGRFSTKLPDFTRAYRFKVTKEKFTPFEQTVDFSTQNLAPGATAELTVTLPEDQGPSAETTYNEGVLAIQKDDLATAEQKMKEAVAVKPDLAPAWSVLAMLAAGDKRWSEALDAADKTLTFAPGDVAALRARAASLKGLGRNDEAVAAYDALAAADKSPDAARILFNAGADAWTAKDGPLATRRFEQALAADPKLYQAHEALAEVKIGAKDLDGALAELDRAIEIAPNNAKLWRRKVAVLENLGRAEDAAAAKKKLEELGG